jgi:hypothetical protein
MVSIFKSVLQESTEAEAVAYLAQVSPPFARSLPSSLPLPFRPPLLPFHLPPAHIGLGAHM